MENQGVGSNKDNVIASRSCRWERLRMPLHDKGLDSTTPWPSVLIANRINLVLRELLPVQQSWRKSGESGLVLPPSCKLYARVSFPAIIVSQLFILYTPDRRFGLVRLFC